MNYEDLSFGVEEPDCFVTPSTDGPVMITRDGAWLLDEEGNIIAEIDKEDFCEKVLREWMKQNNPTVTKRES